MRHLIESQAGLPALGQGPALQLQNVHRRPLIDGDLSGHRADRHAPDVPDGAVVQRVTRPAVGHRQDRADLSRAGHANLTIPHDDRMFVRVGVRRAQIDRKVVTKIGGELRDPQPEDTILVCAITQMRQHVPV